MTLQTQDMRNIMLQKLHEANSVESLHSIAFLLNLCCFVTVTFINTCRPIFHLVRLG